MMHSVKRQTSGGKWDETKTLEEEQNSLRKDTRRLPLSFNAHLDGGRGNRVEEERKVSVAQSCIILFIMLLLFSILIVHSYVWPFYLPSVIGVWGLGQGEEPSAKNQVHLESIPVENPICGLIDYSGA